MTDAPPPATAYADAPDPLAEAATLLRLADRLHAARDEGRAYWLRRAALSDRHALAEALSGPGSPAAQAAVRDAVRDAFKLAEWDRRHPADVAGLHGPASPEWDPDQRPYVRQEYAAWKKQEAECESG